MKVFTLMFVALLSPVSVFAASSTDINGIALGTSEKGIKQVFPNAQCATPDIKSTGDRFCTANTTYEGAKSTITYYLYGDRIERAYITFSPDDFDRVIENITERFGRPEQTQHGDLVTAAGVTYENLSLDWRLPELVISARRFADRVDESSVRFSAMKTDGKSNQKKQKQ